MTQDVRYALMFLAKIAEKPWRGPVAVKTVAQNYHLSFKFLEQVVGKMRRAGFLWVDRGRNGGYGLKKQDLTVADVYQTLGHKSQDLFCPFPSACRGGAECAEKELEARLIGMINDSLSRLEVVSTTI